MKWHTSVVQTACGREPAVAPEVISASRSTDIPAFYSDWFVQRFLRGYLRWVNPFNLHASVVSFERTRMIVFWSKNPRPIMGALDVFDRRNVGYYFHFTLNDYEAECLEPGVPPLAQRIGTFRELSGRIGKDRVIWRFDPLILAHGLDIPQLLEKVERVGNAVAGYTDRLIFSYADIENYKKVRQNLTRHHIGYSEFSIDEMERLAEGIASLCRGWGIQPYTCGEKVDLSRFGVEHGRCIDHLIMVRMAPRDRALSALYGIDIGSGQADIFPSNSPVLSALDVKDKGQREDCGCSFSKDVGQYNTCPHLCVYCYANSSEMIVKKNHLSHDSACDSIVLRDSFRTDK